LAVYIIYISLKQSQFIPLQNVVYFITLLFWFVKSFTFYINDVLLFKCPFPGPKGQFYTDPLPIQPGNFAYLPLHVMTPCLVHLIAVQHRHNSPILLGGLHLRYQTVQNQSYDSLCSNEHLQNEQQTTWTLNVRRCDASDTLVATVSKGTMYRLLRCVWVGDVCIRKCDPRVSFYELCDLPVG